MNVRLPLTDRQQQVYDFIVRFTRERGMPPSVRETAAAIGSKNPTGALCHLAALQKKGWITRQARTDRGTRPTEPAKCPHCGKELSQEADP